MSDPPRPSGSPDFTTHLGLHPGGGNPFQQPSYPAPDYAHWGKRAGALILDQLPIYVALIVFCVGYIPFVFAVADTPSTASLPTTGRGPMITGAVLLMGALVWNLYNRWFVAGRTGQSLGKRVAKIVLTSEQTAQPIGPMNAFLRDLVHILDALTCVGYLWPLWDDRSQTFADMLMKTIVLTAPPRSAP
jgi:uncharacterized RDD family membrane protein YckC